MKNRKFYFFTLLSALFIGICFTTSDFIVMPYSGLKDIFFSMAQWSVILLELYCFLFLLGVNKWVFLVTFPLLTTVCAILAYFRITMYATLTPMLLDATFSNDLQTSMELVTPPLILTTLLSLLIACLFVYYRLKKVSVTGKMILPTCLFLILLILLPHHLRFKRAILERIPFNIYYTGYKYADEKQQTKKERLDLTDGAICSEDSLTVVLVIGESLRADHLPMNGYSRNTMPRLSEEDIIAYPHIFSEFTITVRSVPHLLTRADSTDYSRTHNEKSCISFFNACGFHTTWLANQESLHSYVYFMKECDTLLFTNINKSDYSFGYWTDSDLLPFFDEALQRPAPKRLIILHTIGSHWWYNSHYTEAFAQYQPTIKSKIISSCTQEEMINSYDNTILYTDHFLSGIINRLKEKNAIFIYQSDHGEALGENGIWLHATETPETQNPACMIWMSPRYKEKHPALYETAQQNRSKRFRTDYLFHSLLDAASIQSQYLNPSLSIFRKAGHPALSENTQIAP